MHFAILQGESEVTWQEAAPADPCSDDVTYDVQFTRTLSLDSGWKTIAESVPEGTNTTPFDVSFVPFTEDGGMRVRAKDAKGLFSDWSTSIDPFTIANHPPAPVTMLSPIGGETFDNSLGIVWAEADVKDVDGHDVFYRVQVTANFSDAEPTWTTVPGQEALTEGTTSVSVNSLKWA